jgi:hypothetical protein
MIEWSKDHVAVIGPLNSTLWFNYWNLNKLKTGWGPWVERRDNWLGRSRSG